MIITNNDIVVNPTTVISDMSEPLVIDSNSTANIYMCFSATSIDTLEITTESEFPNWADVHLEKLTNQQNIDNLYAIHFELEPYYYSQGESQTRSFVPTIIATVVPGHVVVVSTVTINQQGCVMSGTRTVTFNLNGHGTSPVPPQQTVNVGQYAEKPENPVDSTNNYYFIGWFEPNSDAEFDFLNNTITNDVFLYAHWEYITSSTRALITLNHESNSAGVEMYFGYLVTETGGNVIIGEKILWQNIPSNFYYLLATYSDQKLKKPRFTSAREITEHGTNYITDSWPSGSATISTASGEEWIFWIGQKYKFIAGFNDSQTIPYGVRITHTDTIGGDDVTTTEIIKFGNEAFNISFRTNDFICRALEFTSHKKSHIDVLFTSFRH